TRSARQAAASLRTAVSRSPNLMTRSTGMSPKLDATTSKYRELSASSRRFSSSPGLVARVGPEAAPEGRGRTERRRASDPAKRARVGLASHRPRRVQTLDAHANVADPPAKAVVEIPLHSRTAMIGDFTKVEAKRALDRRCGERLLAILIGEQREQGDRVAGGS